MPAQAACAMCMQHGRAGLTYAGTAASKLTALQVQLNQGSQRHLGLRVVSQEPRQQ